MTVKYVDSHIKESISWKYRINQLN